MPNDSYHETRVPEIGGVAFALSVIATLLIAMRVLSRRICGAQLWWDDWTIFAAMILDWGLTAACWLNVKAGAARHTEAYGGPVTSAMLRTYFKDFLVIQIIYYTCAVTIKTSLLLLYYRLFGVIRWYRFVLLAAWVIVFMYWIVETFVAIFECKPVAFYWDMSIKGGACINQNAFYGWIGVTNLLIDFLILSLPLPTIWRLRLPKRGKVSLSGIFLLGLVTCVASIVRVTSFNDVVWKDITYTIVTASI
ncbi:MAG: hypothetical protein Q9181_006549 [Wetmoreana brouardii]